MTSSTPPPRGASAPAPRLTLSRWLAAVVLLLSGCLATPAQPPAPTVRSEAVLGGVASAATGIPSTATAADDTRRSASALDAAHLAASRAVVERRVAALAAGDRQGWLASLQGTALRTEQAAVFDRMRAMGVRAVHVESVTPRGAQSGASWQVEVAFTHQLAGTDTSSRRFTLELTLRAASDSNEQPTIIGSAPADRPQPWDLPGLGVHRLSDGLVLATGGQGRLSDVSARYLAARAAVVAIWGTAPPAVVIAPSSDADAARLLGRDPTSLDGVAAVTDGPLSSGAGAGADRVVLVPTAWDALTEQGREVVLAHELTHVTVRSTATRSMPLWLSEGFAEYVAYAEVDLPERRVVGGALELVRREGLPASWPTAAAFEPGNGRLPAAYGLSLLAVRSIADRHGQAALVRLCRAVSRPATGDAGADGGTNADTITARMIREVLQSDPETERLAWQRRIERLLAP